MQLSLILPVYNQEEIIQPVFERIFSQIKKLKVSFQIILVENGSQDKTWEKVKNLASHFPNTKAKRATKGYGSAVLSGLASAQGTYVCYMPSDGQIDMRVFPLLWKLAKTEKWEVVKIKRVTRETKVRSFISAIFTLTISFLFNIPRIDINGSPRIILRKNIGKLRLSCADSFIDAEFAIKAKELEWKVKEISMRTLPRAGGESSRSWRTFAEFFYNIAYYRLFGFES